MTEANCSEAVSTDRNPQTLDALAALAGKRVESVLQTAGQGLKVIDLDGRPQFRLEMLGSGWRTLSRFEAGSVYAAYGRINRALRKGVLGLEPGFDSLRIVQLGAGLDALAPGIFDAGRVEFALSSTPQLLASVSGQWFPPGVCVELTPGETDKLIALIGTGAALEAFLVALGVAGPAAPLVAAALALLAAEIALVKTFSAAGAVGFKITGLPPFIVVVPYPV